MEKKKLKFSFLAVVFLYTSVLFAQSEGGSVTWTLLQAEGDISISSAFIVSNNQPLILLKVENQSESTYQVTWDSQLNLFGKTIDVKKTYSVTINAMETMQEDSQNNPLSFYPYNHVTAFKDGDCSYLVKNLKVTRL